MEKPLLPFLTFFLFCLPAFAQIGIKAGGNLTSFYSNEKIIDDKQATVGFQGGLLLHLPVGEAIAVQPEVLFTRRGANLSLTTPLDIEAHLDYVDVPVLLVLKPRLLRFLRLHAGPQFSYLTKVEYEYGFGNGTTEVDMDRKNYNTWDVGMAIGLSLHSEPFFVELRYTQGFTSVEKESLEFLGLEIEDSNLKNYGLQLSAGLLFGGND